MSRFITIYGPSPRQKLSVDFQSRFVEIKLNLLEEYFDLKGVPLSLKPLLSHEQLKFETVLLSTGEEGFLLEVEIQFYKISIDIALHETPTSV
ncbi:hypothetical protein GOP47_0006934 [Adiantum capillus-veneris]|uniref:Uncharacterized protein n=1 Tax=Adiantum capillus-veneris TaxID=13818 RepID=A0A9D4ZLE8_ADICA|nr:hypothetical protein GOP47_0006934 [Adiantum capillus-veneris]